MTQIYILTLKGLNWLKELIVWSWTYLWAAWFVLVCISRCWTSLRHVFISQVGFVLFYLRGPLKIGENLGMATMFLSTLTPKVNTPKSVKLAQWLDVDLISSIQFYVALTGTSSLISGLILIFEWWYYRRYGMSFIEQVYSSPSGHLKIYWDRSWSLLRFR